MLHILNRFGLLSSTKNIYVLLSSMVLYIDWAIAAYREIAQVARFGSGGRIALGCFHLLSKVSRLDM